MAAAVQCDRRGVVASPGPAEARIKLADVGTSNPQLQTGLLLIAHHSSGLPAPHTHRTHLQSTRVESTVEIHIRTALHNTAHCTLRTQCTWLAAQGWHCGSQWSLRAAREARPSPPASRGAADNPPASRRASCSAAAPTRTSKRSRRAGTTWMHSNTCGSASRCVRSRGDGVPADATPSETRAIDATFSTHRSTTPSTISI